MDTKEKILHRVVTFLDRKELDFLDDVSKDILFSTGIKIPRSTLLRKLIDIYILSQAKFRHIHSPRNLVTMLMENVEDEKKEEK